MKICYICAKSRQCINGVYCLHHRRYMERQNVISCKHYETAPTTKVEKWAKSVVKS